MSKYVCVGCGVPGDRSRHFVSIASGRMFICGECVDLAAELVRESRGAPQCPPGYVPVPGGGFTSTEANDKHLRYAAAMARAK